MSGMWRRAVVAVPGLLLATGCGGSHEPQPDPAMVSEARSAALTWFTGTWRNDFEAACPNIKAGSVAAPPFGGCGMAATNLWRSMNPDAEALISVDIAKLELRDDRAKFDSDHVTVNGRPLSDSVDRAAGGQAHVRYTYTFRRIQNLWYFQKADSEAGF